MILFGFGSALFKGKRMKDLVKFLGMFLGMTLFLGIVQSSGEEKDAFALLSAIFFFTSRIHYNRERLPFVSQEFVVFFTGGWSTLSFALYEVWTVWPALLIPCFLTTVGLVAFINDDEYMEGIMTRKYLTGLALLPSLLLFI
jgi:hypothetical protein